MTTSGAMNAVLEIPGLRSRSASSTSSRGPSIDQTRENGIWLNAVYFGGSVDANQTGTGDRGRVRRVSFRNLILHKIVDETTSAFFTAMCTGRRFPEASLGILRPFGDGRDMQFFRFNLSDITVASQNFSGSPGDAGTTVGMTEELQLAFATIQIAFAGDGWSPTGGGSTFESVVWDVNEHRAR